MGDADYVRGLEIATEGGLAAFRAPGAETALEDVKSGRESAPPEPEIRRAAVNGGAVVAFGQELSPEEKSDVLYSTQLAQRAASARHDPYDDTEAWYGVYREVMLQLGWVGRGFAFEKRSSRSGKLRMDQAALDVIQQIALGGQLAILVKALEGMKALAGEDRAIRIFELQAAARLRGNYQIGSAARDGVGLSMALGAFRFEARENKRGFLFFDWGDEELSFWAAADQLTLNADHYATLRDAVKEKLGVAAWDYFADLPIAS